MNRYVLLYRIRGPILLLTFGVTALLSEFRVLSFGRSWPLYFIVLGVLLLLERAIQPTLPTGQTGQAGWMPGAPVWTPAYPAPSYPATAPPAPGTAIVPASDVRNIESHSGEKL